MFDKILNFFKGINFTTIAVAAAAILLFVCMSQCNRAKQLSADLEFEKTKNAQNIAAMTESIKTIQNHAGDYESSKAAYLASLDELKTMNSKLANKLAGVQGLISGIYADMSIKLDTIISRNDHVVKYDSTMRGIKFETTYDKDSLYNKITGETKFRLVGKDIFPVNTYIYSNELKLGITYGMRETDDRYECFAISKSKNIKFNELEGVLTIKKNAVAPEKKKHWGLGMQFGPSFDFVNGKPGLAVSVGINYSIWNF